LSRREGEVAQQLLQAGTTSEIADRLFISEPTVNTHIRNIYRKCDVHSRAQFLGLVNRSIAGSLGLDATLGGHLFSSASQQTVVSS
jgi:DNA-binding CsgD family transcriptional regulator